MFGAYAVRKTLMGLAVLGIVASLLVVSAGSALASGYTTAVLADLPQALWSLDGSTSDLAGAHALTSVGASFCSTYGVPTASTTQAFCGNGSGYFTFGQGLTGQSNTTTELWMRTSNGAPLQYLFELTGQCGVNNEVQINSNNITPGYDGCGPDGNTAVAVSDSNWHMYDFVYTTSNILTYGDGAYVATGGSSFPYAGAVSGSGGCIGCRINIPDRIMQTGTALSMVASFPTALPATNIANHYAARNAGAAAPSALVATPAYFTTRLGGQTLISLQATDSSGADITASDTFTFNGATADNTGTPAAAMTCTGRTGHPEGFICTANLVGGYFWSFSDAHSLTVTGHIVVAGAPTSFTLNPPVASILAGGSATFRNVACDAAGVCTSQVDGWNFDVPLPSSVTCGQPVGGVSDIAVSCGSDHVGTYTLTAHDAAGLAATVKLVVGAGSNASSVTCASDPLGGTICWLSQVWRSISSLPGDIVNGIYDTLFVSRSGRSYLDLSASTAAQLIPMLSCRSGQAPTASDGVHCIAFPFSIPFDVATILGQLDVSPIAPTFGFTWDMHLYGHTIHNAPTFDVGTLLESNTMGYVRNIEFVLFVVGMSLATGKLLQLFGVV